MPLNCFLDWIPFYVRNQISIPYSCGNIFRTNHFYFLGGKQSQNKSLYLGTTILPTHERKHYGTPSLLLSYRTWALLPFFATSEPQNLLTLRYLSHMTNKTNYFCCFKNINIVNRRQNA
jgi:hypothetical protein